MLDSNEINEVLALFPGLVESCDKPTVESTKGKQTVSLKIYIKDGSEMKVYQSLVLLNMKFRYSYHWMRADRSLIIRWDNTPNHLDVSEHHRHVGTEDNIEPSEPMTLRKVLAFIADKIGL